MKSIAFFKTLVKNLGENKTLKLFLVDVNSSLDKRISSLYETMKIKKQLIQDDKRRIYGELGIIVLPTLLGVTKENKLHSVIPGLRDNLDLFFQTYISALLRGHQPEDVFSSTNKS